MEWLHERSNDPEAKNDLLTQLLHLAGGGQDGQSAAAAELLLLALWPGLCTIRHRLRPFCRTGTLEADLVGQLTIGIRAAQPERITRVAATLLRNVERDLRRTYQREACASRLSEDPDVVDLLHGKDDTDRPEAIIAAARAALGDEGVLLSAVHVAGLSQKEAADLLGISHAAARKRCQRAMTRLQIQYDP